MTVSQHSAALAVWIEHAEFGSEEDGLHLGLTDLTLVAKALRTLSALAAALSSPEAPEAA